MGTRIKVGTCGFDPQGRGALPWSPAIYIGV